jgi:DNA-binding MarR family transcriptional regulator
MNVSRFEEADESPGFLLWQLTNLWQHRIRSALAPLGITHVQFVLLASAAWFENSEKLMTQAVLARHAHTDIMMTSQVLRTLEEKGLLTRAVHPTDTRARVVSLTTEGREVARRAFTVVETVDAAFFAELGAQYATFLELMRQLIKGHTNVRISSDDE